MTDFSLGGTQDLVAILDGESYEQLFTAAQPMRVSVRESKRVTKFEVEDGTIRSDHVVDDQIEIAIDLILESQDARDGYQQIRQAKDDNRLVIVQTKVSSYESMLISEMPHDETTELGGAISMPLRLVEWRTVTPQFGALPPSKVMNKAQASTTKSGQKQTTDASDGTTKKAGAVLGQNKKSSILYRVLN